MRNRFGLHGPYALLIVAVLIGVLRAGCAYNPVGACGDRFDLNDPVCAFNVIKSARPGERTEGDLTTVLEEKGGLKIQHGHACAKKDRGATKSNLGTHLREKATIPTGYDATVFLNGWNTRYSSKDHHVMGLGVALYDIKLDEPKHELNWTAFGVLADKNGDDAYSWCYYYTVLAWPKASSTFDIRATTSSQDKPLIFVDAPGAKTSLHSIVGNASSTGGGKAPLPMGFGLVLTTQDKNLRPDANKDRHILQVAFDLGTATSTVKGFRKVLAAVPNTFLWSSGTILKDDDTRPYTAAELVSIIGGSSVSVIQPALLTVKIPLIGEKPFANELNLKPKSDQGDCGKGGSDFTTRTIPITIKDVPFDYAVPILNGWDVSHRCDEHVTALGAWISDFKLEQTGPRKSTIRATLHGGIKDKGADNEDTLRFELAVLGVNRGGGEPVPTPTTGPGPTPTPFAISCNGKQATIVGTAGDDHLVGTAAADVMVGLGGNDELDARGGDDTLCGNEGNDNLNGGTGTDFCDGGIGVNTLSGCES